MAEDDDVGLGGPLEQGQRPAESWRQDVVEAVGERGDLGLALDAWIGEWITSTPALPSSRKRPPRAPIGA